MSKSIRSYPVGQQRDVAERRVRKDAGGLGTIAAKNWLARVGAKIEKAMKEFADDGKGPTAEDLE